MFNTRKYSSISTTSDFVIESEFQRRIRNYTLAFTYRFNQKKKQERSGRDGSNGTGDFEE